MSILRLLFILPVLLASQSVAVKQITINDGLSQNYIFAALQDANGFLWFGTKDGLNRYDGYSFRIYRKDNADSLSLADNTVTAMYQGADTLLWIGTAAGGVQQFHLKRSSFLPVHHTIDGVPPLRTSQINVINATRDGRILIGTSGNGLFVHSPQRGEWQHFRSDTASPSGLLGNSVADVAEDAEGNLWVAANGLNVIRPDGRVDRIDRGAEHPQTAGVNRISALYCDEQGRMWVSYRLGIDLYYKGNRRTLVSATEENDHYWWGKLRRTMDGMLWTTTAHHLHRIDPGTLNVTTVAHFPEWRISGGFMVDRSNNVWIGTAGWGALMYNPRTALFGKGAGNFLPALYPQLFGTLGRFIRRHPGTAAIDPAMRGNEFRSPFRASNGDLFIATSDAVVLRMTPDSAITLHSLVPPDTPDRKSFAPSMIFEDSAHTVWIVRNSGLVRFFDHKELYDFLPLYPDAVASPNSSGYSDLTTVSVTRDGLYWFGTPTNGLLRYDPKRGTKTWYRYREFEPTSLSHNHVLCIAEDPNEPRRYLWIGTDGGGLNRFDRSSETFTSLTEQNGFPNNTVYGILTDERKTFWISTNKGLVNFDPATQTLRSFDVYDGLQSNEFNRKEYLRTPDGRMVFGGVNGYNIFRPSDIGMNTSVPKVVMTDLRLFNRSVNFKKDTAVLRQPIEFTDAITLKHSENVVTFEFAAMEFSASAKNQFQYILEGFHTEWIHNGTSRTATFTNIDPGEYFFKVKAANGDGIWNDEATMVRVTVLPPFWRTWWFMTIVILAFLATGPIIYYLRVSELKKEQHRQQEVSRLLIESQESERKRIAQEMHDSLGQELLVIKNRALMGLRSAPEDSKERRHLEQISEGATGILKLVRSMSHMLRPPELDRLGLTETIRSLLTTVREASGKNLVAEIDEIDGTIDPRHEINLVRILQEALSNIEKHSEATDVTILLRTEGQWITLRIQDNGKGFTPENNSQGIGLAGITERVRILNGSLIIASSSGSGTTITVTIPITQRT